MAKDNEGHFFVMYEDDEKLTLELRFDNGREVVCDVPKEYVGVDNPPENLEKSSAASIKELKKLATDLTKKAEAEIVRCPACQEGYLYWDEEIQGAVCDICAEQFYSKEYIDLVREEPK